MCEEPSGYGEDMSDHGIEHGMSDANDMGHHGQERKVEVPEAAEAEEISTADVAERIDEDPDEQVNRQDPVWDDEDHED
jgi:hypothetical protein